MLLYVTPMGLAKCLCILRVCVSEGEKDVYLCLLKGERESTASHFASLCSLFVRVFACQAVRV